MSSGDYHVADSIVPLCLHIAWYTIIANWYALRPDVPTIFSKDALLGALRMQTVTEEVWQKQRSFVRMGITALLTVDGTLAEALGNIKRVIFRLVAFCDAQINGPVEGEPQYEQGLFDEIVEVYAITHPDELPRAKVQAALSAVPEKVAADNLSLPALFTRYPRKGKAILQLATNVLKDQEVYLELQKSLAAEVSSIVGAEATMGNALEQFNGCCALLKKVAEMPPSQVERIEKLGYNPTDSEDRLAVISVLMLRAFAEQFPAFVDDSDEKCSFDFGELRVQAMLGQIHEPGWIGSWILGALQAVALLKQHEVALSKALKTTTASDLLTLLKLLQDTDFESLRGRCIGHADKMEAVWQVGLFDTVAQGLTTLKARVSKKMSTLAKGPMAQFIQKVSSVVNDVEIIDSGEAADDVLARHLALTDGLDEVIATINSTASGPTLATIDGLRRWFVIRMATAKVYQLSLHTVAFYILSQSVSCT